MSIDLIQIQLYILGIVVIVLISICIQRVVKSYNTESRNSSIFFLLIYVFTLLVVLLGLIGKYAPYQSPLAIFMLRLADSFTVIILMNMTFFASSVLYGTIHSDKKALFFTIFVIIESTFIVIFYWVAPIQFTVAEFNEITYVFNVPLTIAYFPLILPILYLFIKMEKIDEPNKWKHRLLLIAFICAIMELAFDMPGTFPELLFVWRSFALVSMIIVIIALLLPRKE
ncbi:MAG: hypothetical protein EAX96_10310 [Candidatus Lokiarchaeota archaeon]|nr:hypothetical protein [Candidatus Lokiarchaeota archaeon]